MGGGIDGGGGGAEQAGLTPNASSFGLNAAAPAFHPTPFQSRAAAAEKAGGQPVVNLQRPTLEMSSLPLSTSSMMRP
jgi:hypothetical protein